MLPISGFYEVSVNLNRMVSAVAVFEFKFSLPVAKSSKCYWLSDNRSKAYGDASGRNCGWYAGGTGPVWGRALGVEVGQSLRLVSLVIARSATGDLMTVQGRLC